MSSRSTSSSSGSGSTEASDSPPPLAAAIPPPVVFHCADYICCRQNTTTYQCTTANPTVICPGIGTNTPPSANGTIHPGPAGIVDTCTTCRQHAHDPTNPTRIDQLSGTAAAPRGFRTQLCHACIHDEVALYWQRQGTGIPTGPSAAPSLALAAQWPTLPGVTQNLCICQNTAVTPYVNHCHACRDAAFTTYAGSAKLLTQRILHNRTTAVITGKAKCNLNGGTAAHLIPQEQRSRRWWIGRKCPCGRKPKQEALPSTREYITVCLACMGVKIVPGNLPPRYRQHRFQQREFDLRSGVRRACGVTKGPKRAARRCEFRVNIERGWVEDDPLVGGTY